MATNGQLPTSALTKLSTPGSLLSGAAASFERLKRALGTTGTTAGAQAYRTLAEQVTAFKYNYTTTYTQYKPGLVDKRIWAGKSWYRKKGGVSAAVPGTSNHGLGNTVDWQNLGAFDSPTWKRFAVLAVRHGWNNKEGRSVGESWHWTYNATEDQFKTPPPVVVSKKGRKDMFVTKWGSSRFVLVIGDRAIQISKTSFDKLTAGGAISVALDNPEVDKLVALLTEEGGSVTIPPIVIPPIEVPPVTVVVPPFDISITGTATPKP